MYGAVKLNRLTEFWQGNVFGNVHADDRERELIVLRQIWARPVPRVRDRGTDSASCPVGEGGG